MYFCEDQQQFVYGWHRYNECELYQNVHAGFLLTGLRSVEIPEDGISIDFSSTKKSLLLPKASLYPSPLLKEITRVGAPTLRKWWSEQDSLKQCHLHNYDYVI